MPSHLLTLPMAVHEIISATTRRTSREHNAFPFFLVVGAGVSVPFIPLAGGIERLCREEIARHGLEAPQGGGSAMDRYEACFRLAFPQAEDRRAFLHDRIHRAPISPANFRLAHLLGASKLTNLVFTTNFDEMLTRALRLFGHDVVVCDHPKTTQRIDPKQADVLQVVHVHGTHWFYDCCNLKGEIEGQARSDLADNASMGQLLDRVLFDRSPLIAGYSGWEGDVIMTALARRLRQPMPYNLYWFCFTRADADALPAWLRDHPSVRLVIPPSALALERRGVAEGEPGALRGPMRAASSEPDAAGGSARDPTLSAQQVFEALILKLRLDAPPLTVDPLRFFAEHLERNLAADGEREGDGKDFYLIREVIDRVKLGLKLERDHREGETREQREVADQLARVSDAVRRSAYGEAAEVARGIKLERLTEAQRTELEAALESVYLSINTAEPAASLEVCRTRERLARLSLTGGAAPEWSLRLAKAIHGRGFSLDQLGRRTEAIAAYEEVISLFNDTGDPALRARVARALRNKSVILRVDGRIAEAIAICDEVVARFGRTVDPALTQEVVMVLFDKAALREGEGKHQDAIGIYDDVLARVARATEPGLPEHASMALLGKGLLFGRDGRRSEEIAVYDDLIGRFGAATDLVLRTNVILALLNKGVALASEGRRAEAIAIYDAILTRYGAVTETSQLALLALALANKAYTCWEDDRKADAIALYDEVVARFGATTEPELRNQVATALVTKGLMLGSERKIAEAIVIYDDVIARLDTASEPILQSTLALALLRKGIALFDEGKREEAIEIYNQMIARFDTATEPSLQARLAQALANKGGALAAAGKPQEAMAICHEIVRRFGEASDPKILPNVAWARRVLAQFSAPAAVAQAPPKVRSRQPRAKPA